MKNLLLFISLISINFISYSSTCSSTGTGDWSNPAIWSCGHVPVCGDDVVITGGTTVTISSQIDYSACGSPFNMLINGTLIFTTGNKLKLPNGSIITLTAAGRIEPGNGGGNSNLIEINGEDVWNAAYGIVNGPVVITQFSPLPIELISFTAKFVKSEVELNWITSSETNNDYFTIEKTPNGADFEFVSKIKGAGNSSSVINYAFIDPLPLEGKSYYRLRQTDFNGDFTFSSLIPVNNEAQLEFGFDLYLNPLIQSENIKISIKEEELVEVLVVVYDVNGRESFSKVIITEQKGNNIYAIDNSSHLSPGIYIITATSQQKMFSKRLIVQ